MNKYYDFLGGFICLFWQVGKSPYQIGGEKEEEVKNLFRVCLLICLLAVSASAAMIWVGMEDIRLPVGDKDYNDLVMTLSGANLSVIGSGKWQSMVAPNQDGSPYWDNLSYDGDQKNVGYFMTGTGAFLGDPYSPSLQVSQLQYWGVGASADPSFLFFSTGVDSANVLLEISSISGTNSVYWFNQSTPNLLNSLFAGSASAGSSASFNPTGNFGLMFGTLNGGYSTNVNGNQFAIFRERMCPPSDIPEPGTYAMMGAGLLSLAVLSRRRKS